MDLSQIPHLKHLSENNFFLLAGPCAIEGEEMAIRIAERVVGITDKIITLEVSQGTKLKVLKSQIGGLSKAIFEKEEK